MLGDRRHWCMVGDGHSSPLVGGRAGRSSLLVQGGGGSSSSLGGGVVGSLCGVLMAVVGPHGWWWLCSSPLVGGNGPCIVSIVIGWLVDVPSSPAIVIHQWCHIVAHVVAWLCR